MSRVKVKLTRDLYLWEGPTRTIFHATGEILEGDLDAEPDWLVGCPTVKLDRPFDGGRQHLGVGYDCVVLNE